MYTDCCSTFELMLMYIGTLMISPAMMAPVCHVGDPLNITCMASTAEFIEWSIMLIYNHLGTPENITSLYVGSTSQQVHVPPIAVNSTTFTFKRDSPQGASPLISTLSIDSVSIGLNGTIVRCMEVGNTMTSASITIQIVDVSNSESDNHHHYYDNASILSYHDIVIDQYSPMLGITSEEYEADNVSVTVEWSQQMGVVYTVRILPPVPIMFIGNTSLHLTVLYNTEYNLSVVAAAPCRVSITAFIGLNYGELYEYKYWR